MDNEHIIDVLNGLIVTCKDGEYGFRGCARQADAQALRSFFESCAAGCERAAGELQRMVVQSGGQPKDAAIGGSAGGALHRGWLALRGAVAGPDDLAVLEQCERGEDSALERYREALDEPLPALLRARIEAQYAGVVRNHERVRSWRERLAAP
jgi:uncharacterized protein (TIGR02284 family)